MKIVFTNTSGYKDLEAPIPSYKLVPKWLQNHDSYIDNKKAPNGQGITNGTIKKCMPVFDAITAGYIIVSPADVFVSIKDESQYFEWSNFSLIEFHSKKQAENHPIQNDFDYPKWINFWGIKTPKGYSSLFVQPFHRESVFTIMPAVVDTDKYISPVNFPFTINNPKFEGLIPRGTPIAQIIPFKREKWEMTFGGTQDLEEIDNLQTNLKTKFFDRYKSMFRTNKEYR